MRNLITSLSLFSLLMPVTAFAQGEAVTLDEIPEDGSAAPAPAPAPAPAAEPAPAEPAPAPEAAEPVQLDETGGGAAASGSTSAGFAATGTTAAAPLAPAPAAATAEAPAEEAPLSRPGASTFRGPGGGDDWAFSYSGYFRAPMRLGIGSNTGLQHRQEGIDNDIQNDEGLPFSHTQNPDTGAWEIDGTIPKKTTFHLPVVPDAQYGSWQNTSHQQNDWAEMFFSVGNGTVSGTLAIQGFQFTDSAWKEPISQFGIGQGWIEVNSDLGFENVKFNTKVGSHWARYGMAGVYDAGELDTYLFGRTHTMGITSRLDLVLSAFDLGFEGGFGVKQPDPQMFNRARFTNMGHGHVIFTFPSMEFTLNAMHAWSNTSASPSFPNVLPGSSGCNGDVPGAQCTIGGTSTGAAGAALGDGTALPNGTELYGGINGQRGVWGNEYPTGTQTIVGADARLDFGLLGYLYAGYSHQFLKNALVVDNAIESIHSFGAAMFNLGVVDNYLESAYCNRASAPNESCSNGTGSVGTILGQYELGLANFGFLPGGMDIKTKLYGMINFVSVDDIEVERLSTIYEFNLENQDLLPAGGQAITIDDLRQDGVHKKKIGMDVEFFALDWMSVGVRGDMLDPNSKLDNEGFSILSPRVTFRSKAVTHEEITLQYSRYIYKQRECVETVDGNTAIASPADDPFRQGSLYGTRSLSTGYPLRLQCVNPGPSPNGPTGFGQHSNSQEPGRRGAPTLSPDENVITLMASMWW